MTQLLSLPDVRALACDCLTRAGVPDPVARAVAAEVAAAEAAGERCHGMEALLRDIRLLRYGRILAAAHLEVTRPRPGLMRIDAGHGLAAFALSTAMPELADMAQTQGIATARLDRASAPGAMIRALQPLADRGLVAVAFGTSGPGRIAHPDLAAPIPLGREICAPSLARPPAEDAGQPADTPLGGPVAHGAWLVAMTLEAADTGLLDADIWDSATRPPPPREIAFSVELLEQIVTA
jgi:(2R)-3-sulfolactate dehydrogenase (NADP+)